MCCNLGSLNLSEFVEYPYTEDSYFNFSKFENAVAIAVEALDDIIDENIDRHAIKEQAENSKNYRNIGLGCMGYANALFKLGITYGSEEAIAYTGEIFRTMLHAALKTSCKLAQIKGAFPKCKPEKIAQSEIVKSLKLSDLTKDIEKYGLRNCSLLSVAPTGSIGSV